MKQLLTSFLVIAGLLGSVLAAAALTASSASAAPTAGSNRQANTVLGFKGATPDAGSVPSIKLTFTPSSTTNCQTVLPVRVLANNSSATRVIRTHNDPTPTNIANNDLTTCNYTVTISSNLDGCTYSYSLNNGTSFSTGTSFVLQGDDSPNFATATGAFANVTTARTIVIKPAGCSHPSAVNNPGLLNIRNIETTEQYRLTYTKFGNCALANNPLTELAALQWSQAALDLNCNWKVTIAPISNVNITGCQVDAMIYFHDGTFAVDSTGEIFIGHVIVRAGTLTQRFPAHTGKRITRVDIGISSAGARSGVCQEMTRLTITISLDRSVDQTSYRNEKVTFEIEPYNTVTGRTCTPRTTFSGSAATPATITLIKSPAGSSVTCSYKLTAPLHTEALQLAGNQLSSYDVHTAGVANVNLGYGYVLRRIPVRVGMQVLAPALSVFRTNQIVEVHVTVPGACGADTAMFGGITGRTGVEYGLHVVRGVTYAIGPNARIVNPAAAYSLPPFVEVNGQKVNCTVRVTATSVDSSCTPATTSKDAAGRTYAEATWAEGATAIEAILQFDCSSYGGTGVTRPGDTLDSGAGQIILARGWTMLAFNGVSGTTPQAFAAELGHAVSSLWVWHAPTQAWRGWRASSGSAGLTSLTKGDVVMAHVPATRQVNYDPATLLDPPAATGRLSLPRGYSVQVFGGGASRDLASLLGNQARSVAIIYRWNSQSQSWSYHLPGRSAVAGAGAAWFDTINPGDAVFIYSTAAATIPWS